MNPFDSNPVLLSADEIHYQISDRVLIDRQSLVIRRGERIALVGRNGTGKSSFLKILGGVEPFFQGEITRKKNLRACYLSQEVDLPAGITVREAVMAGAADLIALMDAYGNATGAEQHELEKEVRERRGWELETTLSTLAEKLRLPAMERVVDTLSGGEKRRVGLARAFLDLPDLILLDEPTNHLDSETIEFLEEFIPRSGKTFLVVTHDRFFLDKIATRIVELSFGKFYSYDGNYSQFLRKKAERISEMEAAESKRLAFLRRELEWIRRGPKARTTKSQSRVDRYWAVAEQAPLQREETAELLLPPAPPLGNIVAELKDLTYEIGGRRLLNRLNLSFAQGMRLGIVGPNGMGKTTLLRLILGELLPSGGSIRIGEKVRFNYADQHRVHLHNDKTVFEEVGEGNDFVMFDQRKIGLWGYLRNYLFQDEEIHSQVGKLSGGERNRLVLAMILKRGGNFMLMDEPTNDLDLPTLRILEESLNAFEGCLAVVSHDRYFLDRVCTHILAFEGGGQVFFTPGNYSYYQQKRKEQLAQNRNAVERAPVAVSAEKPAVRKLKWAEARELERMEETIAEAEKRVTEIEEIFSLPDFHVKYGKQTAQLTADLEAAKAEVARLYARWEELEEISAASKA